MKWQKIIGWFLAISYGVGSPVFGIVEFRTGIFSQRFDYSSEFLFLVTGAQFVCALLLLSKRTAPWSAALLTVFSLGAVYSHFKIGSPLTAIPSAILTAMQVWYGYRIYRQNQESE
jgi:hypothetical protein